MEIENTNNNCTIDETADCANCNIRGELNCKFDRKYLLKFLAHVLPFFLSGFFGLIYTGLLTGNWFFLIGYACFLLVFFSVLEIRILCRHCPYYAKPGKTIHCHANEGLPRLWEYDPSPLNRKEKIVFVLCILFFGTFPAITETYGIWFIVINYGTYGLFALLGLIGITIATLATVLAWLAELQLSFCPNCVNFSCPFNRVPKDLVDAYLEKNPVMKEAWEKSGYKLGN